MTADLYEVLEVSPEADQAAITAAYRRLVFAFHPDRNGSPEAAARTAQITSAYRILGDPAERARYDSRRNASPKDRQPIPRAVLGTSKLTLYDLLERKPRHRHVRWEPGIWSAISNYFPDCKARGCLVLLRIDPATGQQVYQHGDPGPTLRIDPQRGEFKLLEPWLAHCHQLEDAPPN
ncbi:MAG TPA: J domain-containing protein [Chloroflexota bacterium]|nr:J domain-containing protein [Chloroflexota bacterium]